MKVLNIDGFVKVERQVTLNGIKHDVRSLNVQQFIDNLAAAEALDAANAAAGITTAPVSAMSAQVRDSVQAVSQAIPTLPMDQIKTLPIEALTALMEFIRGDMDAEAATGTVTDTDTPEAEGSTAKKPS